MNTYESIVEALISVHPEDRKAVESLYDQLPEDLTIFLLRSLCRTPENKTLEASKAIEIRQQYKGKPDSALVVARRVQEMREEVEKNAKEAFELLSIKLKYSNEYKNVLNSKAYLTVKKHIGSI